MDVVISEQCQWDILLQCLHLWETKCGSRIQKSDVITIRLQISDQHNKIFHPFIVVTSSSTKLFDSSGWVMQATLSSQSSSFVNSSVCCVVRSESDISEILHAVF